MTLLACISVLVVLQGVQSYILLTASLDDVQTIARELAASPVAGQLGGIVRRASHVFNQQLRHAGNKKRAFRRKKLDSSLESQENQNHQEQENKHHLKRSKHNDEDQYNNRHFEDSQNRTESHNEDTDSGHKIENPKKTENKSEEMESHTNLDEDDKNTEALPTPKEVNGKSESESKVRDNDDIRVVRHEKPIDTDVVALGKNATLYLNSIKKIIETI